MNTQKFLDENTKSLEGKCVVLSGASGGLGYEISRCLASLKADLVLLNLNPGKAALLKSKLMKEFPEADIKTYSADFENIAEVKELCEILRQLPVDYLIHNAGAYAIERRRSKVGVDNVFQINFLSPYYITRELLPVLEKRRSKVVITGSIANSANRVDEDDVDFSKRKAPAQVYGNSKRYLMYAHIALLTRHSAVGLTIAHPGISPTGITSGYPEALRALIKIPMKLTFMSPKRACLPMVCALFKETLHYSWLGPRFFNIWGKPALSILKDNDSEEIDFIYNTAQGLYEKMKGIN